MTTPSCHVYGFSGSPFVWRVLLALDEKQIAHTRTWIARASGEHRSPEMLARNPRGQLPVMVWGDTPLHESMAICAFLELERPEPPLVPAAPAARARTLVLAHEADGYAGGAAMPALEAGLMRAPGTALDDADRARHRTLHEELGHWERYLQQDGGAFLVGDAFTLADIALFPLIAFGVRCGLRLEPAFPALARWYARIVERRSTQSSWPPHWRESPGRDFGLNEL
jgi:glutathione S-transferase